MTRYTLEIKLVPSNHTFFVTTIDLEYDIFYYCSNKDYKIVGISFCLEKGSMMP